MACQQTSNGFKCEKDKQITITSPNDPSNPLVSHIWKVDGVQVSTLQSFVENYPTMGSHTVIHEGSNSCGAPCEQTIQLEIVDQIAAQTSSTSSSGAPAIAIAGVLILGFLGIVMMKGKGKK